MGLLKSGSNMKYAKNSKGKIVPIHEVAWGSANDKRPTFYCNLTPATEVLT